VRLTQRCSTQAQVAGNAMARDQLTSYLTNYYKTLVIGHLNVAGMIANRKLARVISDVLGIAVTFAILDQS